MSNTRFTLEANHTDPIEGELRYISISKYEGDWHSTPHSHPFSELFYITDGRGRFLVEDHSFAVRQDDMVIINPLVKHTEVSSGSPLAYIVLGIEGLSFQFPGQGAGETGYNLYNYSAIRSDLLFYFHSLLQETENREPGYEPICQNLLQVLMLKLTRHTGGNLAIAPAVKTTRECSFVKRYIDANFSENITLESLAKAAHMNKYYLVHAFRRYTGISPIHYLIQKRIEESQSLLSTTDLTISTISEVVGFSSQSYFAQCFKKNTGESPNEYRKRKKKLEGIL